MPHSWRDTARPIIAKVLQDCRLAGATEQQIKKALFDAYPFGERKYYPYSIWLDEIKRQRGTKWPVGHKRAWENNQKRVKTQAQKLAEWEQLYGRRQA